MFNLKMFSVIGLIGLVLLFAKYHEVRYSEASIVRTPIVSTNLMFEQEILAEANNLIRDYFAQVSEPIMAENDCLRSLVDSQEQKIELVKGNSYSTESGHTFICRSGRGEGMKPEIVMQMTTPLSRSPLLLAMSLTHEYTHVCQYEREINYIDCESDYAIDDMETVLRYEYDPIRNSLILWQSLGGYTSPFLNGATERDSRHLGTINFLERHAREKSLIEGVQLLIGANYPNLAPQQEL